MQVCKKTSYPSKEPYGFKQIRIFTIQILSDSFAHNRSVKTKYNMHIGQQLLRI